MLRYLLFLSLMGLFLPLAGTGCIGSTDNKLKVQPASSAPGLKPIAPGGAGQRSKQQSQ